MDIFRLAQLANGSFSTAKIKALSDIWYKYASLNGVANAEYIKIQEFLKEAKKLPSELSTLEHFAYENLVNKNALIYLVH